MKFNCLGLIIFLSLIPVAFAAKNDLSQIKNTRTQLNHLIQHIQVRHFKTSDAKIAYIAAQLADIPYGYGDIMGEGLGHSHSAPIYRLDKMNCQTLAQVILALLFATNLNTFDQSIRKISYGALSNANRDRVHFFNRNHFIESDFNRVNEMNGLLEDTTSSPPFASYVETIHFTLERQPWFLKRINAIPKEFLNPQQVQVSYLPKYTLILSATNEHFYPNANLFASLPTPAVVEIVHDPYKWFVNGKNIKELIGTHLAIAHLGIIYKQQFHHHELIYYKISCMQQCIVTPVYCQKKICNELMFIHATRAYPKNFVWIKQHHRYACVENETKNEATLTPCNRVERLPLFAYLTSYQDGVYPHLTWNAILGLHIEKILLPH